MLTPGEITEATGGELHNPREVDVRGFSIDTRKISPGEVFVPLPGSKTDGHKFIDEAYEKGAAAALANSRDHLEEDRYNLVLVDDTEEALLRMARYYRGTFDFPVVGVTGSWGKTTTKELISSILSEAGDVHKSPGNYNTEYGLPLALLETDRDVDFAVFELGLQYPGDVEELSSVAKPTLGLITGAGRVHLENFQGAREIAREKLKIASGMRGGGKLVINSDCRVLLEEAKKKSGPRLVRYGTKKGEGLRYWITDSRLRGTDGIELTLNKSGSNGTDSPDEFPLTLETELISRANAANVLAAASVGLEMGMEASDLRKGVRISPLPQRLQPREFSAGTVIDDTYNANPEATRNALNFLADLEPDGKKLFVFGDMMELGQDSVELHRSLADPVARAGIDVLLAVGRDTGELVEELQLGTDDPEAKWFEEKEDLLGGLRKALAEENNLVLVKGSRGMEMEEVVSYLEKDYG